MSSEDRWQAVAAEGFRKKAFTPRSFLREAGRSLRNAPALLRATAAGRVPAQLVEKLMLATTSVNECRYCARVHTEMARRTGVDDETIDALLAGEIERGVAEDERAALLFAQRYAESDGEPGREAVAALEEAYGERMAADVRAYVRAFHVANLTGNSVDRVLFRLRRVVE